MSNTQYSFTSDDEDEEEISLDDSNNIINNIGIGIGISDHQSKLGDSGISTTADQPLPTSLSFDSHDGLKNRKIKNHGGKIKAPPRFYKPPHFIRDKKVQRTISLIWGIITILISGTLYGFSLISNEIRDRLGFSQTDIGVAISIGDVGIYIGITVGFFFDTFGPFYTLLLATCLYIIGYMGVWGVVNGSMTNNVYLLSFFLFLIGQASHSSFTASIVSNSHNYTIKHRGKISGFLVGMFAISSGVFGLIYKSTFRKSKDVLGYLLFLAILLSSVSLIAAFIVREVKVDGVDEPEMDDERIEREEREEKEKQQEILNLQSSSQEEILKLQYSSQENLIIHVDQQSNNNANNNANNNNKNINDIESGGSSGSSSNSDSIKGSSGDESVTNNNEAVVVKKEGKLNSIINNITNKNKDYKLLNIVEDFDENSIEHVQDQGPNYLDGKRNISGFKLLKTLEFELMWVIYFFCAGGSLMFLNNIAVMGQSLKKPDSVHSDLVIIFACSNLFGRVTMGLISDAISKKLSRFWCVVVSSLIVSITHLVTAFDLENMFYPATVLTGIGYGGMVSINVSLTSLLFGPQHFGLNFGFLAISSASASLMFSSVSSKIYDELSEDSETGKCYGTHCFQLSFILSFVFNLICVFIGMFIIYHIKKRRNNNNK